MSTLPRAAVPPNPTAAAGGGGIGRQVGGIVDREGGKRLGELAMAELLIQETEAVERGAATGAAAAEGESAQ